MAKLHQYQDSDGKFDYTQYVEIQTHGNKQKIDLCWVSEKNIEFLAQYLTSNLANIDAGVCHGTRRGLEQQWFGEYLGIDVIGTEISETAANFPNTIQWDFHEPHPKLVELDFVYSNSFDHSYDPAKSFNNWVDSLKIGGLVLIEHSRLHEETGVTRLDPFGASIVEISDFSQQWCQGRVEHKEILQMPEGNRFVKDISVIVFKKIG